MPKSKEFVKSDSSSDSDGEKPKKRQRPEKSKAAEKDTASKRSKSAAQSDSIVGDDGTVMYPLSNQRNVSVSEFKGSVFVNIREYYEKDGKTLPGRKGISLSRAQWEKLKSYIPDIDRDLSNAS